MSVLPRVCAKMEVLEGALDWLDFHDGVDATSLRFLEIISTSLLVLKFHQETLTDDFLTAFCIADLQSRGSGQGTTGGYGAALNFQNRPNAHGGANNLHSVGVGNAQTTLQPRTNTHQKFSGRINAAPLPVCLSLPILVDGV